MILIVGIAMAGWWLLHEPPLKANEIRITFDHGETCRWSDWSFRIRREVVNNRGRGAVFIPGLPNISQADDTDLRVFAPDGTKLRIFRDDLRQMGLKWLPDPNSGYNNVTTLTLTTASNTISFPATELPKFSRSRVLVPVASHYFPEQDDDFMDWGNVRMTLAGTAPEDCSTDREISLTRPGHPKNRTPILIEFADK